MAESLERVIEETVREICPDKNLKEEQRAAILALLRARDVLGILPTGFGKSLIFHVYIAAKTKVDEAQGRKGPPKILVICPLASLVEDQIKEAESLGLSCTKLRDIDVEEFAPKEAIIFASAEEVQDGRFKAALKRPDSNMQRISAIVVDESHTLETWTGKRKSKDKSFRGAYGELAALRSLCKEGIPLLALTGTADASTIDAITTSLAMRGYLHVFISPTRRNLRINVIQTKKENMACSLDWFVTLVKNSGVKTPKTIIFCNTMKDVATVTNQLMMKLGSAAYHPPTSKRKDDCIISIYHSLSWKTYKESIVLAFKGDGTKRVVVATTALSMGVNFPDVRYILNWGPARTLLDHHQEAGRAGRDGQQSDIVVIYHGNQLSQCEEDVKHFVRASDCLRVASYRPLDPQVEPIEPRHDCCSNCRKKCCCDGEKCTSAKLPFEDVSVDMEPQPLSRPVSKHDRKDLAAALKELQMNLVPESTLFDSTVSHGFSAELINDLVEGCATIFTLDDLTSSYSVFSLGHALKILEVFQEIFGDIPNLEGTVHLLDSFHEIQSESIDLSSHYLDT